MPANNMNEIDELNEWQEHQYNYGYWVNRFSPLFLPRHTLGIWLLCLIDFFFIVPAFFLVSAIYFFWDHERYYLILILILGAFGILVTLRVLRLRPVSQDELPTPQEIIEQRNALKNKEEKKMPKRRKNYK